ncbi:hypothetical protein SEPCBS57363_003344 [Sporothrix epigloea]|uniref:Bola-like protein n=1 Tax=Sporothrix epigloea TaxID=1892477 RepID=A0ABP0DMX5_9PEZI
MICSACRLAQQQLIGRRAAAASLSAVSISSAVTTTTVHRSLVMAISLTTRRKTPALSRLTAPLSHRSYSVTAAASSSTASTSSSTPPPIPKPDFLDDAESHIWDLLVEAFAPHELSVRDVSGGCGSMYGIEISSECFRGANTLKQQRMVNAALGDLIKGWHGVQLKTRVP